MWFYLLIISPECCSEIRRSEHTIWFHHSHWLSHGHRHEENWPGQEHSHGHQTHTGSHMFINCCCRICLGFSCSFCTNWERLLCTLPECVLLWGCKSAVFPSTVLSFWLLLTSAFKKYFKWILLIFRSTCFGALFKLNLRLRLQREEGNVDFFPSLVSRNAQYYSIIIKSLLLMLWLMCVASLSCTRQTWT